MRSEGTTLGKLTIVFTDIEDSVRATGAVGNYTFRDKRVDSQKVSGRDRLSLA